MSSLTRRLISLGFSDLEKSERFLAFKELADIDQEFLFKGLALANDPDLAVQSLVRLLSAVPAARSHLSDSEQSEEPREALFRLLGASEALCEFLMRNPDQLDLLDETTSAEPQGSDPAALRASILRAVGADPQAQVPTSSLSGKEALIALRRQYRRHLTQLAIKDLCAASAQDAMPMVGAELADLAAAALEAALAVARTELAETFPAEDIAATSLSIIAMGKCGARELNYISDVDVMYVVKAGELRTHASTDAPVHLDEEKAVAIGNALAASVSKAIFSPAREPGLWEVDANLRPEGKDGPLVRTLDSFLQYYRRWASDWEFQALLKSRAIAGDMELGHDFESAVEPLIWQSSERPGFVASVQAMRRRVTENIPDAEAALQIKLGKGGLRDVEFTVQLLQLVHGKTDESLRVRSTTSAIAALKKSGFIGRRDAAQLDGSYRYLRVLEHRIQLVNMRRTHLMPTSSSALKALSRALSGPMSTRKASADVMLADWNKVKRTVSSLHENIFYRPILASASHLSADDVVLTSDAARARLAALGYLDTAGAQRHIEALTAGVSRRAALQRQLLPVLLGWLADGVDPDAGLLAFRRVSESLGTSHWYLGMLRDHQVAAERLCHVLSSSRFVTDLLEVSPEATAWFGNDKDLVPVTFDAQWAEIQSKMSRHPEPVEAMRLIRLIRQREILRTAIADCSGLLDQDQVFEALSNADRAAILGALMVAEHQIYDGNEPLTKVVVVAMGRAGGREIGYGSDADVLFVHRSVELAAGPDGSALAPAELSAKAQDQALKIVQRLTALLTAPVKPAIAAERVLQVDADLRPEGKSGPLVRSLDAYSEYYGKWSSPWEAQALLRALPIAGAEELSAAFVEVIDPIRYPVELGDNEFREIKRIKARMESERLPRGADPARHVKLGRGGLSDVEWLVQLWQLQHAREEVTLQTTSTIAALHAAQELDLVSVDDAELLEAAWRLAAKVRNANVIWSAKPSDLLPTARADLEAVARWCGYEPGNAAAFEEHYLSLTRRARGVFERLFYG